MIDASSPSPSPSFDPYDNSPGTVFAEAGLPTVLTIFGILLVAIAIFVVFAWLRNRNAPDDVEMPLAKKLDLIAVTSAQLARLNTEVQAEFELQRTETERLQAQAEDARAAASLNREQQEAVQSLVRSQMRAVAKEGVWGERWFQIVLSVVFFGLGIGATLILQAVTGR